MGIYDLRFSIYDFDYVKKRWRIVAVAILLLVLWFAPRPWQPRPAFLAFRKVICSPVPTSLKNLEFSVTQLIDEQSITSREHFAFSVSSNDLRRILSVKGFQAVGNQTIGTNGPPWFRVGSIGSNGQTFLFTRGKRKDCLWVDNTGTNCFYLYELVN